MKGIRLSLAASLIVAASLEASQTYQLSKGWNLVGSLEDNVTASTTFKNVDANSVWKYSEGWSAVSPNGSITASLTSASLLDADLTLNAGDGFWVNVNENATATANGTAASDTSLKITKDGWHLLSLKSDSELDVAATFKNNDKITTVWKYEGKWKAYSPQDNLAETLEGANIPVLETIKPGEGFWVNASGAADDLVSPPVVGGTISLEGLEDTATNGKILYSTTFTGSIQLYSIDDTEYENPLLTVPVTVDSNGTYSVTSSDFVDATKADPDGTYVIRAVIKKAGEDTPIELSAVKTQNEDVEVSPITSAVKTKIIETINTFFQADESGQVKLSDAILETVDSLVKVIVTQVKQDVQDGKMKLNKSDFATKKTLEEEQGLSDEEKNALVETQKKKADKLKSQLESESSAAGTVAILSNKISEEKEKEMFNDQTTLQSLQSLDKKIDISSDINIAQFAYKTISTITKSGLSVHSGDGRVIAFLPVPSEEFDTLPGDKYSITVETDDENITVGDDPALRIIDLQSDLKNVTGYEAWTEDLKDIFDTPVMPFEAVKILMKETAAGTTVNLLDFGQFFVDEFTMPEEMGGEKMFTTNPLAALNGADINETKDIVPLFMEGFVKNNYDKIFWDQFWFNYHKATSGETTALEALTEFTSVFGVQSATEKVSDLTTRIKESGVVKDIIVDASKFLNATVPFDINDTEGTLFQFGADITVDENTVMKPMTAFALTNLIFETKGDDGMSFAKKPIMEVFPFLNDLGITIPAMNIWFPDFSQNDPSQTMNGKVLKKDMDDGNDDGFEYYGPSTEEILNMQKFNRDIILAIVSKATNAAEPFSASDMESSYTKVLKSISEVMPKFMEKVETAMHKEQEIGGFDAGNQFDSETGTKDTTITFKVTNNQGQENLNVSKVKFVPMLDDTENYEWVESNASVWFVQKNSEGYYENNTTLNSWDKLVDIDLTQNEEGQYRQTDMFAVYAYEGSDEFFIGHFPIFPQDVNNLHELWFDSEFMGDAGGAPMFNTGFHEYPVNFMDTEYPAGGVNFVDETNATLFYPFLDTVNGEQVGENILKLTQTATGEFSLSNDVAMAGTLTDGEIEIFVLATNWDENGKVWFENEFAPSSDKVDLVTISKDSDTTLNEGGMVLIKIDSDSLEGEKLIGTVDYVNGDEMKLFVEPIPMFDGMNMGGFDYWDTNTSVTKLVADVKNHDGTPNTTVNKIAYTSVISCNDDTNGYMEYQIADANISGTETTLSGNMVKSSGGKFEKSGAVIVNPALSFDYDPENKLLTQVDDGTGACNFNGNIAIELQGTTTKGEDFTEPFGHFFLFKGDENNFGEFWWQHWDDNNGFDPYKEPMNMFPTDEMNTTIKFQVKKWDPEANSGMGGDVVNTDVTKVIITRIVESTEDYNWEPLETDKVEIEVADGWFEDMITLRPEGTEYAGNYKETGNFRIEVVTENGTFDIGWFPLFAQEENYLEWLFFNDMMFENYEDVSYWDIEGDLYAKGAMGQSVDTGDLDTAKKYVMYDTHKEYTIFSVDGNGSGTYTDYMFEGCDVDFKKLVDIENVTYTGSNGMYVLTEPDEDNPGETESFDTTFMMSTEFNLTIDDKSIEFILHQIQDQDADNTSGDAFVSDYAMFEGNITKISKFVENMIKGKECNQNAPGNMEDPCDLNKDGLIDDVEQKECAEKFDPCDFNKDGIVDDYESGKCGTGTF